jgi:hypothetical protein
LPTRNEIWQGDVVRGYNPEAMSNDPDDQTSPPGTLDHILNEIRSWLALHKIEPAELTYEMGPLLTATLKLSFKNPEDERLFNEDCPFGKRQSEQRRERVRQQNLAHFARLGIGETPT